MKRCMCKILAFHLILFIFSVCGISAHSTTRTNSPENYVFFNRERECIKDYDFYNSTNFVGAQIKYTWKELEPEKDKYDFSAIEEDLSFLLEKNKKLFLQLQDVSFSSSIVNVPDYLIKEQEYNGGVNLQYNFFDNEDNNAKPEGFVARRWDPVVSERFYKLLNKLGENFDGTVEGIVLPETAVDFGSTGRYFPQGYTHEKYYNAVKEQMAAAHNSFRKSLVLQYVNFMPGEWLPSNDKGYLSGVFEYADSIGVGIGGPDVIPYKENQMNHSYRLASQNNTNMIFGFAVQEGNYEQINERTGKQVVAKEIYNFAKNYLKAKYVFWYPQKPYFEDVMLLINSEHNEFEPV